MCFIKFAKKYFISDYLPIMSSYKVSNNGNSFVYHIM